MKPSADDQGTGRGEVLGPVQFEALRRRRPSRELVLVRWAFWVFIAAVIAFVIFIIWGLATHEPKPFPYDSDF